MDVQFKPSQELTFDTAQQDSVRLYKTLAQNPIHTLNFELQDVHYCDSAGLALLIEAHRLCKKFDVTLKMKNVPKSIFALAEFCGIENMLELIV